MTKRRNPWHDESPFQLKTHISTREVAYGIDGGQYKNQIYGYTKQLMLNGAKEFYAKPCLSEVGNIENNSSVMNSEDSQQSQKMITSYYAKSSSKHKCSKSAKIKTGAMKFCDHENSSPCHCTFCSNMICINCRQICHQCQLPFCSVCSVLCYDSNIEFAICLSCKT
ncbi:apoptosis regulatory protein Siva-like [Clavelina lepadiformis]|uniref:Apoptosis regulatory protein Siva n=1 Tax=Clavelina lepadiformis TaxID=159417 RepID=A0ABP0GVF9_CLALP